MDKLEINVKVEKRDDKIYSGVKCSPEDEIPAPLLLSALVRMENFKKAILKDLNIGEPEFYKLYNNCYTNPEGGLDKWLDQEREMPSDLDP